MHTAYDAHDEAALLGAVHEGHQDLAALLDVTNALHLLRSEKRAREPQRGAGQAPEKWEQLGQLQCCQHHGQRTTASREGHMLKAQGPGLGTGQWFYFN